MTTLLMSVSRTVKIGYIRVFKEKSQFTETQKDRHIVLMVNNKF